MSFLTPPGFLGALIAIPILLLYMLRLRRRELVVSSNFLWQQIVRDREANTPWQRLRRNLLLILQLIVLALLVLALARPAQIVPTVSAEKTVILLDASASMNATDSNGRTRFAEAQEQALNLLNEVGAEDQVSIIRVAEIAEPLSNFTGDLNRLRTAIRNAQPGRGRGDWDTAITLAVAGAEGAEDFRIILIGDGGLSDTIRLPENIPQPVYIPIGTSSANITISALATRSLPGQAPQLFAQVENHGAEAHSVSLLVRLDGEIWDSITQEIAANTQRSFVFRIDRPFTTIQAELLLDENDGDYLALDNSAYAVAGNSSTRRVLLISAEPNIFLEQVLRSLPAVQIFRGDAVRRTLPETPYDLYIFDSWLPDTLPDGDMLILNPPGGSSIFSVGELTQQTANIRIVERSHPLASFLNVANLNLREFRQITGASWAQSILAADGGAILLAGENRSRQIMILPFDLLDSDLPLQIAWPLLMSNALEWFAPANLLPEGTGHTVGDVVRIAAPLDATGVRVTLPDGSVRDLTIREEALSFTETQVAGFYRVEVLRDGEISANQTFVANLFGTGESRIAPVAAEDLQLGGGEIEVSEQEQFGFREFWSPLAFVALIVLLIEWVLYHRRMQIPAVAHQAVQRTTARQ